jgi:hypothetical protein
MAETLISPGVLARENDQSFITAQPLVRGAAVIGPTVKGPVERPTLISSFSSFQAIFGGSLQSGSGQYTNLTSIAANQYFQNGGESLLVTRVVPGGGDLFSPATSSYINTSSATPGPTAATSPFILETISEGEIMNNASTSVGGGALTNGTSDNVRWEIASVNTSSGVFSLLIRRGNDNQANKVVLESYNNISLDPFASNYISKAIGDMSSTVIVAADGSGTFLQESGSNPNISAYVRVKAVNFKTPNYFNNDGTAKNEFTSSLPAIGSGSEFGSFGAAIGSNIKSGEANNYYQDINDSNSQGVTGSDYTNAIALLANQDEYQYNVISAPGIYYKDYGTQCISLLNNTIARGDSIFVMDLVPYNTAIGTVTTQAASIDSSYGATYWPWLQTIDPNSGELVYIPASTFIPGVYAFTDASSDPWFAPAGITRGGMGQVVRAERKLTSANRDVLYEANINPIATFPQQGVVVFGQKNIAKSSICFR